MNQPFLSVAQKAHLDARRALRLAEREGIVIEGIRLAASEQDRSLFAQGLVLLREAEDMLPNEAAKTAFRQSPQTVADATGKLHTLSVTNLRSMLIAYGQAYQAMWTASKTRAQPEVSVPDDPDPGSTD